MVSDRRDSHHLESVKKCPYCDARVLSRSLHGHVRFKSDEAHGARGEVPDGFDPDNAEEVGKVPISVSVSKPVPENERIRCKFCDETFKGWQGLRTHLGMKDGDGPHPNNVSDRPVEGCGVRVPERTARVLDDSEKERAANDAALAEYQLRLRQLAGEDVKEVVPRSHLEDLLDEFRERSASQGAYYKAAQDLADVIEEHTELVDKVKTPRRICP